MDDTEFTRGHHLVGGQLRVPVIGRIGRVLERACARIPQFPPSPQPLLDAPLPELGTPTRSAQPTPGARIQQELQDYLADLQNQSGLSEWLIKFRQHLSDITNRWGTDLFVCYDIAGVPPTNNALESRFGRLRREQRRISGRQFNTATLLDEGPYLVWECGDSEAQVLARLRRVAANRTDYQQRYDKLCAEQERRRLSYRLQYHRPKVFRELETEWAAIHSGKTV